MAQGKHFKKTGTSYKVRSLAVAAVTAGLLLTPNVAFASGTIGDSAFEDGTASQDEAQTWVWDGAGNMTLNNYNGGGIYSEGNLTLELNGTNKITSTDGNSGVTANGNLTIQDANKDGGSLDVNITGDYTGDGIGAYNRYDDDGNQVTKNVTATIDGATVNVNVTNTNTNQDDYSSAYGIYSEDDVNIKNGANVTVNATANDYAYGIAATHVAVTDSTVTANATATAKDAKSYGIFASDGMRYDEEGNIGDYVPNASITLTNSTVKAKGGTASIYAVNSGDKGLTAAGTITINNSFISTPGGARIQDVRISETWEGDEYRSYGQVIGTGTETITSQEQLEKDAVKDVVILPAPKAAAAISAGIPQTSDVTLPVAGTFAASALALLAGLGLSRRRQAKHFAE